MPANGFEIQVGSSACSRAASSRYGLREILFLAPDQYTDVYELLALDTRHNADYGVIIGAFSVHESPPRKIRAATPVAA